MFICDDKDTNKQTNKQTDRQTKRQTNKQTREENILYIELIATLPSGNNDHYTFSAIAEKNSRQHPLKLNIS